MAPVRTKVSLEAIGTAREGERSRHNLRPVHSSPSRNQRADTSNHRFAQVDRSPFVHESVDSLRFRHALFGRSECQSLGFGAELAVDRVAEEEGVGKQGEKETGRGGVEDRWLGPRVVWE